MAIIGEMRKRYWLLVAIIGVALLLFVLSDFQRKGSKHSNTLAVVAGEKVAVTEFNKKYEENIEIQKANTGKNNLTAEESSSVRESTWMQMINDIIMTKQYEKLGVNVSVEELEDLITGNNPHPYIVQSFTDPKTGQFDKKAVSNFLQNLDQVDPAMKQRYLMMEKAIKNDRINTKYTTLISKGFYVPTAIAKRNYVESNSLAKIRLVGQRYMSIPDSAVTVTDADYAKYYDENKYKFIQDKPARDIEYVVFQPIMSEEDQMLLQSNAKKLYDEFLTTTDVPSFVNSVSDERYDSTWKKRGSFSPIIDSMLFNASVGHVFEPMIDNGVYRIFKLVDRQSRPDSLHASHILISYAGTPVKTAKRSHAEALRISDSILNVVKSNPTAFDNIASTLSDDEAAKEKHGDLGWFADGAMVPEFNSAVLNGSVGEIKKVETQFGYHIIKILGKKDPSSKIRVAAIDLSMEPGSKTIEDFYNKASEFAATNNTIEQFEKAGKQLNMRSADRISADNSTIPGFTSAREIVRWAFNENTKKGNVSNVFEIDGSYVVAALKNKVDKGVIPLEIIKEPLKPMVVREKKAELLIKRANDKFARIKDINALVAEFPNVKIDTLDVSFQSANVPNYGFEPTLAGQIFASKQGKLCGPVKGEQAVFIYILDQMINAPEVKEFENQKKQLSMYFQGRVNSISNILQEKANIVDHRLKFF